MFSKDYKLSEDDMLSLAALIERKDFRLVDRFIQWQVAVMTDDAMQTDDEKKTIALKGGVTALKNLTALFKAAWEKGQEAEKKKIEAIGKKDQNPPARIFE